MMHLGGSRLLRQTSPKTNHLSEIPQTNQNNRDIVESYHAK